LLQEGRDATSLLRNINKENRGYTYTYWWLNVCHNGFDIFEEKLTLDDTMIENKVT
jgi:hypothetical protein